MEKVIRKIDLRQTSPAESRRLLNQEWLVTNGLGGYASGTISGAVTWRYHGLLIAALPAPLGRTVMLNHLAETLVRKNGERVEIGGLEHSDAETDGAVSYISEFRLENQMPVWRYDVGGIILEKHLVLLHGQNTVHIGYRLLSKEPGVKLELRPSMHFRGHEHSVSEPLDAQYVFSMEEKRFEVRGGEMFPRLRFTLKGAERFAFIYDGGTQREIFYQRDADRGYDAKGKLWSPGWITFDLNPDCQATLIASTETWRVMQALSPDEAVDFYQQRRARLIRTAVPEARASPAADLVLAADQFIINPVGRLQDAARAHAAGDEIRTVIAGYHWFTDWGRDTMISLEGLTLTTGRHAEAGWILRTFAHYVRDGLIPNLFPEGANQGLYHTADASLWFFHAMDRYLEVTNDRDTLRHVLPKLIEIADSHLKGTHFGIGADPVDGLLKQGAPGYQLTWMDAKVDDWVVTPRRGKAVEINGLWFNALTLLAEWLAEQGQGTATEQYLTHARRVKQSFNERFWYAEGGYLYDVVDGEGGNSAACRPNQLLSFSLKHAVLDESRWKDVLETVRERLMTPVGLRTLTSDHREYKAKYFGDLRARDAAYHQGTVWAWLIGPFVDAWLKVYPGDRAGARRYLEGFVPHLNSGCIGSINEIFDAEAPFTPRGCIAQAWSVAEVLRCWVKTTVSSSGKSASQSKPSRAEVSVARR